MIFFRDQRIGDAEHKAFTRRFGPFADDAYTAGVPGHPEVQPVIKQADDRSAMVFGSGWHTDSPFLAEPPAISTLRAVKVPPFGGDTMWANSALAWRMLSPTMQGLLGGLRVHFSMRDVLASAQRHVQLSDTPIGRLAATRTARELPADLAEKIRGSTHPLSRTHPVTGERSLYVDGTYAIGIEGLEEAEAANSAALSGRTHDATRLHLPAALGAGHADAVGQPTVRASGLQRLQRARARDVSHHHRG